MGLPKPQLDPLPKLALKLPVAVLEQQGPQGHLQWEHASAVRGGGCFALRTSFTAPASLAGFVASPAASGAAVEGTSLMAHH